MASRAATALQRLPCKWANTAPSAASKNPALPGEGQPVQAHHGRRCTHQRMPLELERLGEVEGSREVGADDGREERGQQQAGQQHARQASRCCRRAAGVDGVGVAGEGCECGDVLCTETPAGSEDSTRPQVGNGSARGGGGGFSSCPCFVYGGAAQALNTNVSPRGLPQGGQHPQASPKNVVHHVLLAGCSQGSDRRLTPRTWHAKAVEPCETPFCAKRHGSIHNCEPSAVWTSKPVIATHHRDIGKSRTRPEDSCPGGLAAAFGYRVLGCVLMEPTNQQCLLA